MIEDEPLKITPHVCPECGATATEVIERGEYTWSDTCETRYASMEPIGDGRGRTRVECDSGHGWWAWIDAGARLTTPADLLPLSQTWFRPEGTDAEAKLGMWMSREMCRDLARACRAVVVTLEHVDAKRAGHDEAEAAARFERYGAAMDALESVRTPAESTTTRDATPKIAIREEAWLETGPNDNPRARLLSRIEISGTVMHLEAIAVTTNADRIQRADSAEDSLASLAILAEPEGQFDKTAIRGRDYVLVAYPVS